MNTPLLLQTPADMLQKAEHDLSVMRQQVNAYTVFNCFVTCYHVQDYVRASEPALQAHLEEMFEDKDFQKVRFLCNRGKHLELDNRNYREHHEILMGARSGIARSGAVRSGESVRWHIVIEGQRVNPIELGENVIAKWKDFFDRHSVPR
jgi:hypothetical protein